MALRSGHPCGAILVHAGGRCAADRFAPAALIFVQLPVYMLHQLEERGDDPFRRFVNAKRWTAAKRVVGRDLGR